MRKNKVLLALVITFTLSIVTSNIAYADNGVDPEIDVSWTPIKKPSSKYVYPNCKEQKILLNPKRSFLGIGLDVKDKNGETIGWNGHINLNLPSNQISQLPIKFCYPLNLGKKVKYPLKLEVFLKYSYIDPERGSTRTLEIPYKFKK